MTARAAGHIPGIQDRRLMLHRQRCRPIRAAILAASAIVVISFPPAKALAATVDTVFVIAMENHNFTQPGSYTSTQAIFGNANAPYFNSLITAGNPNAAQTSYATNYVSVGPVGHPSETNYIWTEAGSNLGVTSNDDPYGPDGNNQNTNQHLSGLLAQAGISWRSYQEDIDMNLTTGAVLPQSSWTVPLSSFDGTMPGGATPNAYNGTRQYDYAAKHNAQVFFTDTNGGDNSTTSNTQRLNYAPLQQLQTDLTNNTLARFNWITSDQFNDMHSQLSGGFTYNGSHKTGDSANIAQGDNYLSIIVPQIMASQAYQNNGAILIWFDETEGGDTSAFTIPYVLISPLAKGNAYQSTITYDHSSTLRTLQEMFQVGGTSATGFLGAASTASDQSDMFQSGVIPTGMCTWTGGGANNNWSSSADWIFAPTNGNSLVFAGSTRLSNTNDSLTNVASVTFSSTAGAFTLSGNALTISGGGITNNSTTGQTLGMNLTLGAAQQFNAASGNLTINGTINNGGNALTVTGAASTALGGNISGAGSLVKTGAGMLTLNGNNTYTGGTTVNAGTLVVGHYHALGNSNLTINSTATTQLAAGLTGPVQLDLLAIAGGTSPTATFDITDNNLIVHNGNLATMTAQVKSGFDINGTLWTGTGITSSTAAFDAANASGDKAVGMIINDDGFGSAIYTNWPAGADSGGQVSVVNTDVLVKYTYFGDANLDGVTDAATDYALWATGNSDPMTYTGWLFGDFDYSGTVDASTDYSLWATGNAAVDGPLSGGGGGGVQPVPEPSTLVLAALGVMSMAALRRRTYR